jgi:ABC-type oligopeptide transport system substrate-binding subunit
VKRALLVLLLALAGALHAAEPKVLKLAFRVAETSLDPAKIQDLYSRTITPHIFEALYTYDHLARPAKIVPQLAAGQDRAAARGRHARGVGRLQDLDCQGAAGHLFRR